MSPEETVEPRRRRRWPRIVLGCLVLLALAVRVALPVLARSVLESQGTTLLAGTLTVGDVDLSLLRGWAALEDVALRADSAGPDDPPLVAWRRLSVNVGWLDLWNHEIVLEDVGLAGLRVYLDRLASGELVLPSLRSDEETRPPQAPGGGVAEEKSAEPWAVVLDRLTFTDGALQLEDHVVAPPETREVKLPSLRLADVRLQPGPDSEPGRGRVQIELRDGTIEVRTRVVAVDDGFEITARTEAENVPLDRVHVHLPELGWSASKGRLDAVLSARVTPHDPLVAHGRIALRDLGIEVPGEDAEALAWRSLEIEAQRIDLAQRHASIHSVALDGGRVVVRPNSPVPLPVLPGGSQDGDGTASPDRGEAEVAPVAPSEATEPGAVGDVGAERPAEDPGAWSWEVGTVDVTDTRAAVFLEPPPLEVDVRSFRLTGLSSESGSEAAVDAGIGLADGTIEVEGDVRLDPPGGALSVALADVDLGRLVAASGASPLPLQATLAGDVDIEAREDPLAVRGMLELAGVEAKIDDGEEFLVAWDRLVVAMRQVTVGGLLPFGAAGRARHTNVDVERIELSRPRIVATRTQEGIVLPPTTPGGESASADAMAAEAAAVTDEVATEADGDDLEVVVDRLSIEGGDVRLTDRAVSPPYRGHLARLDVDARGIRVPENRFDRFTLSTHVGDEAPIEVKSTRRGDAVTVTGTIRDVPLAQFNPYVTPFGYRIGAGTFSLDSETMLRGSDYDSENQIELDRLAISGSTGDTLFKKTFGVSLGVALALLKDLQGRISLGVPVEGDREAGASVAIAPIVRDALTRAILGAVTSPLKLLGAVRLGGGGKIEAFEPAPVAFVPGTTEIAPGARDQAELFARALAQLPNVRVRIGGRAGEEDVRALSEQAVLAELEDEGGFVGGVRNVFSGGTRKEVREALQARAEGEPGVLEGGAAEQLDEWVAEHPIDDARLERLARERATRFETILREAGARSAQVVVGEPEADRTGGFTEVDVQLATETPAEDAAASS